jgi:hypothetical protein
MHSIRRYMEPQWQGSFFLKLIVPILKDMNSSSPLLRSPYFLGYFLALVCESIPFNEGILIVRMVI